MSHRRDVHSDGDRKTGADTITHVRGDDDRPSYSVVVAVAAVTGTDPDDLCPLSRRSTRTRWIDWSNRHSTGRPVRVGVEFNGCDVVVYGDGRTVVSAPEGEGDGS